jgi:hypothetical protein
MHVAAPLRCELKVVVLSIALAALAACGGAERSATTATAGHDGYRVRQSMSLAGAAGDRLESLEDDRITETLRGRFQRGLPDDGCATPLDALSSRFCEAIRLRPLRPALIRIITAAGRELDAAAVERPIAELTQIDSVSEGRRLYGVAIDLTAEAGSYSGPFVRLLNEGSRRLDWVRARDVESGQVEEVHLPTTLKTAWRVAKGTDGRGSDILVVACFPGPVSGGGDVTNNFRITYTRYSFEDGEWRRYQRSIPGFWENEGEFPERSLFP